MSDVGSIFQHEPGTPGVASASLPTVATPERGSRPLALLAGAGVAAFGGLLWAGVVIATHYDIGILAWFVGAATGVAVARIAGGAVGTAERIGAGAVAAGGILLGKYVIFVHAVKAELRDVYHVNPAVIGYFDTGQMGIYVHNFGHIVRPIYALWLLLAFAAAVRASAGARVLPRRR